MKFYFLLQYRRLKRDIQHFGLNPYVGIAIFLIAFVLLSMLLFKKTNSAAYLYSVMALIPAYAQGTKNKTQFLSSIFTEKNFRWLRLIENLLCAVPFSLFLIFKSHALLAVGILPVSAALSLYNKSRLRVMPTIPTPFSKRPYEFATGFRRMYPVLIVIYTITAISIYHGNLNLGLVCLLSVFLLCMGFYSPLEPLFYVWIHAQSAEEFLKGKIKTALLYSLYLSLPLFIPLLIFYPMQAYLPLIILLIGQLYMIVAVLSAYVNFPVRMTLIQTIQFAVGIIFPPVFLWVIPNFYYLARRHLKDSILC